jgi:hypothetical protein
MHIAQTYEGGGGAQWMRRGLFATALGLAAVLICPSSAGATHSNGQGPAQQLVAGTGTLICCGMPMVHVNAQSDAGGVDPRGHFWIRYPSGVEFGGAVVCVNAVGFASGVTGRIDRVKLANPTLGFVEGNFLNIEITDFGEPGTADLVNFHPGAAVQPSGCPIGANLPISQGNYIVHDTPLLDVAALDLLLSGFETAAGDPYGTG